MDVIESVIQSNKALEVGENFVIQATVLETINGGAGGECFMLRRRSLMSWVEEIPKIEKLSATSQ